MRIPAYLLVGLLFASPSLSLAQSDDEEPPATPPAGQDQKTTDQQEVEKYEKAIKDLPKLEGQMTFYIRKKDVLLVLKQSDLDKMLCVQATVSSGLGTDGLQAGDPLNGDSNDVFQFEVYGEEIRLVKPNLVVRWAEAERLATSSSRSFPRAILANFRIEAKHPKNQLLLVNVTKMFDGNLFKLPNMVSATVGPGYSPDSQNSAVLGVKAFKDNAVVTYFNHFRKGGFGDDDEPSSLIEMLLGPQAGPPLADKRSLPLTVTYNLWFRNQDGYTPRLADPRIGYFTTDFFDVAKMKQTNRTVRFIQRFRLQKADPGAPVSKPVKPIVWYLDSSIPAEYRKAVTDGILFWDKAFKKLGYEGAIQVKDAPNDPDFDHADGRHNLVRWTMTRSEAYAVAYFRPDPISGEIINAAVTVDANYPDSAFLEYKEQVAGQTQRRPWSYTASDFADPSTALAKALGSVGWKKVGCDHANGLHEEAKYGLAVLKASGVPIDEKEYARRMVADLVAHEVGHCLGLRHNFAASTVHTAAELLDGELLEAEGVASSVMDYTPLNIAAVLKGHGNYYNPTIGVYDLWAIEYGYGDVQGSTTEAEKPALQQIAMRSGLPGHIYLTDEDADGVNPLSVRWDLGKDLLGYLGQRAQTDALLERYALTQATRFGEPYTRRNALLLRSIRGPYRAALMALRLVGGVEFRRQLKGDVLERPTLAPVAPATQRAALRFILDSTLGDKHLDLPQDVLFGLSADPDAGGSDYIAPLRQYIGSQQRLVLASLLATDKLDQVSENAFKTTGSEKYTLVEHYGATTDAVFGRKSKGALPDLRRDLQAYYVGILVFQAGASPGAINNDARILASHNLRTVEERINAALGQPALDEITGLHYKELAEQIARFRSRRPTGG